MADVFCAELSVRPRRGPLITATLAAVLLFACLFTGCGRSETPAPVSTSARSGAPTCTPEATGAVFTDDVHPAATPTAVPDSGYGAEFWEAAEALLPYYREIALNAEHGTVDGKVHKWTRPILFYVRPSPDAEKYDYYIQELAARLEAIPGFPGIRRVVNAEAAELTLEFVTADEMNGITGAYGDPAYGYAHVSWYNSSGALFSGSIFIVREAESSEADVLHALTEEFTQAMGLLNDSYRYSDSIFYQGYSTVTQYSEADLTLLKLHYAVEIPAGTEYNTVSAIVSQKAHGTDQT